MRAMRDELGRSSPVGEWAVVLIIVAFLLALAFVLPSVLEKP
jgi:hypothetical protein